MTPLQPPPEHLKTLSSHPEQFNYRPKVTTSLQPPQHPKNPWQPLRTPSKLPSNHSEHAIKKKLTKKQQHSEHAPIT